MDVDSPPLREQRGPWQAPAAPAAAATSAGQPGSAVAAAAAAAAAQTPMTAARGLMQKVDGVARLLGGALCTLCTAALAWQRRSCMLRVPCRPPLPMHPACWPSCQGLLLRRAACYVQEG